MSSALFGILQLDRGEPLGYANVTGLVQAWLQDAGGFAIVGLVVYLLYALSTPTDKSQSEKIRVPVSPWMVRMAGLALVCYARCWVASVVMKSPGQPLAAKCRRRRRWRRHRPRRRLRPAAHSSRTRPIVAHGRRPVRPAGHRRAVRPRRGEDRPAQPVAAGFSGVRRFGQLRPPTPATSLTPNRVIALGALGLRASSGWLCTLRQRAALRHLDGRLHRRAAVFWCALLVLMLFEAEGPVWAIAKLSFKEAVRSQVLWIFLIIFLPFLFPAQWLSRQAGRRAAHAPSTLIASC